MPQEEFYAGLTLSEQVAKLADYHGNPRNRHISKSEHAILDRAVRRLEEGTKQARRAARAEVIETWRLLQQSYRVSVDLGTEELAIASVPGWQLGDDVRAELATLGFELLAEDPGPVHLQALLASTMTTGTSDGFLEAYNEFRLRPTTVDDRLSAAEVTAINRVLYQPSIPIESSPPLFESLVEVIAKAKLTPSAAFVLVLAATASPVLAIAAGTGVVFFQLVGAAADGATPDAEQMGKRLGRKHLGGVATGAVGQGVPPLGLPAKPPLGLPTGPPTALPSKGKKSKSKAKSKTSKKKSKPQPTVPPPTKDK